MWAEALRFHEVAIGLYLTNQGDDVIQQGGSRMPKLGPYGSVGGGRPAMVVPAATDHFDKVRGRQSWCRDACTNSNLHYNQRKRYYIHLLPSCGARACPLLRHTPLLALTPWQSGFIDEEQGVSKSGDACSDGVVEVEQSAAVPVASRRASMPKANDGREKNRRPSSGRLPGVAARVSCVPHCPVVNL